MFLERVSRLQAIDELLADSKWTQSRGEEIANSISHRLGLTAALVGTPRMNVSVAITSSGISVLAGVLCHFCAVFAYAA